ncbi:MAG: alpha/beta hydrolase, partial [Candidatus Latescibacteria bacterium]|nr:alpha/beta hydrolase [Candidatus Latescibacterota bacterium]
ENAVASLEKVRLGGADQWILIRGHNSNNPVMLFLHGGPGMPAMFLAHAFQQDLERNFVVVHWDRLGAGKSFQAAELLPSLTVRQTLDDMFELTTALQKRFDQDRIILVGHSWGSYLGLLAVREHPEYFAAYIGLGQIAGTRVEAREQRLEFLTRKATVAGDQELLNRLASGGDPTENDLFLYGAELHGEKSFWPILSTGLGAPECTLWDALNVKKGADLVARKMEYDVSPKMFEGEIGEFEVPVFFFLGRHDYNTPSLLAAEYLKRLQAPLKEVVWVRAFGPFSLL